MCISAMRPIFNEKVAEKCNLWDLWTVHWCTVYNEKVKCCGWKKKKKVKRERTNADAAFNPIQTGTQYFEWDSLKILWFNNIRWSPPQGELGFEYIFPICYNN